LDTLENINEIIEGCKNNNQLTQEVLYKSYYRVMMTLCVRYTKNESEAVEVMNTAFYKVFKNIKTYNKSKASLYTWIRTIVINTCIDFNKTKIIEVDAIEQAADVGELPVVFSKMAAQDILVYIRQLPNATQTVFNLYVIEGYNHIEIAKLLGISQGTSKWHLSEAKKKLQKLINIEMHK
jgi:RNA polymerase sigma factor (sigma-70 family)